MGVDYGAVLVYGFKITEEWAEKHRDKTMGDYQLTTPGLHIECIGNSYSGDFEYIVCVNNAGASCDYDLTEGPIPTEIDPVKKTILEGYYDKMKALESQPEKTYTVEEYDDFGYAKTVTKVSKPPKIIEGGIGWYVGLNIY